MQITNFLKHHYRHFNAAALIDAIARHRHPERERLPAWARTH